MRCLFVILRGRDLENLINQMVNYAFVEEETRENGDIYISRKAKAKKLFV